MVCSQTRYWGRHGAFLILIAAHDVADGVEREFRRETVVDGAVGLREVDRDVHGHRLRARDGELECVGDDVAGVLRGLDDFADARPGEGFGPPRQFVLAGGEYFLSPWRTLVVGY